MDLDLRGNNLSAVLGSNFNGTQVKDRMEGKFNGGGIPLNVDGGGAVTLTVN
jgi:hypothetical protein